MVIAHNISAINTYNKMGISATATDRSMEKLSSGYKINRAADDAAGLSISEKMRSQIRGLNQASENAQNGISMIQTAEGALNEAHSICQRMRELAVQAANDTNAASDRAALQSEINQLTSEINRIGNTTEFNGMKLLNGSKIKTTGKEQIEVTNAGTKSDFSNDKAVNTAKLELAQNTKIKFDKTASGALGDYTKLSKAANSSYLEISKKDGKLLVSAKISEALTGDPTKVGKENTLSMTPISQDPSTGNWVFNEAGISFSLTNDSVQEFLTNGKDTDVVKLDLVSLGTENNSVPEDVTGITVDVATHTTGFGIKNDYEEDSSNKGEVSTITLAAWGTENRIDYDRVELEFQNADTTANAKITMKMFSESNEPIVVEREITGLGTVSGTAQSVNFDINGLTGTFKLNAGFGAKDKVHLIVDLDKAFNTTNVDGTGTANDNSVYFHVGANKDQVINTTFGDMRAKALGLTGNGEGYTDEYSVNNGTESALTERGLNISTRKGANNAIEVIDNAVSLISQERSKYGAIQNRLEYTINNVDTTAENMTNAESTIRDTDMAAEMMDLTKTQILQQASQAMLAQAMQRPQQVLQLLQQ